MSIKLYTRNTNGSVNVWWATIEGNSYTTSYGKLDGKIQTKKPIYASPKNVGKANETSAERQAEIEVEALYVKQLKSNYFENIEDVDKGFLEPQLAKPGKKYIDKVKWEDGQIVDHKLNGFACIITKDGAFTRTNERYHSIPHILKELAPFFENNPTAYLQGELYNAAHVNELNRIAELIAVTRQPKDITPELLTESESVVQYHLYDGYNFAGITADTLGKERREALMWWLNRCNFKYCLPVVWIYVHSKAQMTAFVENYIAQGGEGGIVRNPLAKYQHKRTKDLLKVKKTEDAEFKVIEVCEGEGDWVGCAKFVWCELPNGLKDDKFKSNIDGSQEHLREVFNNREKYVGRLITVRYQELSPYRTPLTPYTNMVIRENIEG